MTRYVIHREDCPALCQLAKRHSPASAVAEWCNHMLHACSCNPPSPAQLEELVEAAKEYMTETNEGAAIYEKFYNRLDAALKPFTKENQ